MSVLKLPECPTACSGALPKWEFDQCAPELKYSEIEEIFLARVTAAKIDPGDLGSWVARTSSENSDSDHIERLTVKASIGDPDVDEQELSGDRKAIGFHSFVIEGIIDENNDANYLAMLQTQCNLTFKMWFKFADGDIYGGEDGIKATVRMWESASDNRKELRVISFTAKWSDKFSPLRCKFPIA